MTALRGPRAVPAPAAGASGRRLGARAALHLAGTTLGRAGAAFAAAIVIALVAPLAVGGRPYTVLSGSMEPAIGAGDVVVGFRARPEDVRRGDVVTFKDPAAADRLITHRVRAVSVRGSNVVFRTKGDAVSATERWQVSRGATLSEVRYRIPEIGRLALLAREPAGLVLLVLAPLALLGIQELRRIWRPAEVGGA